MCSKLLTWQYLGKIFLLFYQKSFKIPNFEILRYYHLSEAFWIFPNYSQQSMLLWYQNFSSYWGKTKFPPLKRRCHNFRQQLHEQPSFFTQVSKSPNIKLLAFKFPIEGLTIGWLTSICNCDAVSLWYWISSTDTESHICRINIENHPESFLMNASLLQGQARLGKCLRN